jgi:hypothetical protein
MKLREKICIILKEMSPPSNNEDISNLWLQYFWPGEVSSYQEEVRYVNEYLRHQLGILPVNTIYERECLRDDLDEEKWLELFKTKVAPSIVIHGLPDWRLKR